MTCALPNCGAEFVPLSKRQRYCCEAHQRRAYEARRHARECPGTPGCRCHRCGAREWARKQREAERGRKPQTDAQLDARARTWLAQYPYGGGLEMRWPSTLEVR